MVKILSDRLFRVMDKLASPNHSIFLKISYIVNEFVDLAKKIKKSFLVFKVYFNKTYDQGIGPFWIINYLGSILMTNG